MRRRVSITCNTCHNSFDQTPVAHLKQSACPTCRKESKEPYKQIVSTRPIRLQRFLDAAEKRHGAGRYDYSLAIEQFKTLEVPVSFICNRCNNKFIQKPSQHLRQPGCVPCSLSEFVHKRQVGESRRCRAEHWASECKQRYGDRFDYSAAIDRFINMESSVTIRCYTCQAELKCSPSEHLRENTHNCPMDH